MRISENRRLDRLLDLLLPKGSTERKMRDMPIALKLDYARWSDACDKAAARYANVPGGLYEAMISGNDPSPRLPKSLETVISNSVPQLTIDMDLRLIADLYAEYLAKGTRQ